jgi:hypothetical protein
VLWPALWAGPVTALKLVVRQARYDGGEPHILGNFFLGRAVEDPGPLFYFVAIPLRLTPWMLVGLVLAVGFTMYDLRFATIQRRSQRRSALSTQHSARSTQHAALAMLALFVLLFLAMMSVPPKKFDRYALPVFPALCVFAAWGLGRLRMEHRELGQPLAALFFSILNAQFFIHTLAVAAAFATLLWFHPYELAYYNPLLGGGGAAVRTIVVGWGEGYEQVGAYLAQQPDGCERPVASGYEQLLRLYYSCEPVRRLDEALRPGRIGYAVLYRNQIQRNFEPDATAKLLASGVPAHTVRIHGIDYAFIYQLPPPVAHLREAVWGPAIHFGGYEVDTTTIEQGFLGLYTQWRAGEPIGRDYVLFIHVIDGAGRVVGRADVPPGGPAAPTSAWAPGRYLSFTHQVPLEPGLPAGTYWIAIGLYTPDDFARLPLRALPPPPGAPDDGEHALLLEPVALP